MKRSTLISIVHKIFNLLSDVTIENLELLPAEGSVLIVMNHVSFADFPMLTTQHRRDDWSVFITDKYKKNRFLQWVVKTVELVWIDRTKADFSAVKAAYAWLKKGGAFALSPEGTRSKTGSLNQGKEGVAMIALKAGVPIIPAAVVGTDHFFADLKKFRRPKLTFRFGAPVTYEPIDPARRAESLREMTDDVMCRIAALIPDGMHGFYAGNPNIERIRSEWLSEIPGISLPDSGSHEN